MLEVFSDNIQVQRLSILKELYLKKQHICQIAREIIKKSQDNINKKNRIKLKIFPFRRIEFSTLLFMYTQAKQRTVCKYPQHEKRGLKRAVY